MVGMFIMTDCNSSNSTRHQRLPSRSVRALAEVLDGREMFGELAGIDGGEMILGFYLNSRRCIAVRQDPLMRNVLDEGGVDKSVCVEGVRIEPVVGSIWSVVVDQNDQIVDDVYTDLELYCRRIIEWAKERRFQFTHFYFVALAVLVSPIDSWSAYKVGCMARDLARWDIAEAWFSYAVENSDDVRGGEVRVRAMIGLGNTYLLKGDYKTAKKTHDSALNYARRGGFQELEGMALHDLVAISLATGELAAAEEYAKAAFVAYGPNDPRVPTLAHDIAFCWLEQGYARHALLVFRALLPHFRSTPDRRFLVLCNLGRAAGLAHDTDTYEEIWTEIWTSSFQILNKKYMSTGLVSLAEGAVYLSDWSRAQRAANDALNLAVEREELDVAAKAESILSMFYASVKADRDVLIEANREAEALAEKLLESLSVNSPVEISRPSTEFNLNQTGECNRIWLGLICPASEAQGSHSSIIFDPWSYDVLEYATFQLDSRSDMAQWTQTLHFHLDGNPSFNRATRTDVLPPHVHDISVPGGVRAALPHEIPARPW